MALLNEIRGPTFVLARPEQFKIGVCRDCFIGRPKQREKGDYSNTGICILSGLKVKEVILKQAIFENKPQQWNNKNPSCSSYLSEFLRTLPRSECSFASDLVMKRDCISRIALCWYLQSSPKDCQIWTLESTISMPFEQYVLHDASFVKILSGG